MNTKNFKIMQWSLTAVLLFIFISSAYGKLSGDETQLAFAANYGISERAFFYIGLVELFSILLFVTPKTGIIGTLLMAAYMGGAIATHVQHDQSVVFPSLIQAFIWVTAFVRFPELSTRILRKSLKEN